MKKLNLWILTTVLFLGTVAFICSMPVAQAKDPMTRDSGSIKNSYSGMNNNAARNVEFICSVYCKTPGMPEFTVAGMKRCGHDKAIASAKGACKAAGGKVVGYPNPACSAHGWC